MAIKNVYGVICDLMFGSQIQQALSSSSIPYRSIRSSSEVESLLSESEALWIVNLAAKTSAEPQIVEAVLPKVISAQLPLICYAPHIEEARMEWAQKLGAKNIVPRGALIKALGQALL